MSDVDRENGHERMMRRVVQAKGGRFCERCKCCEERRQECEDCDGTGRVEVHGDDGGIVYVDGAEQCSQCGGTGGWWVCDCDDKGEHHEKGATT